MPLIVGYIVDRADLDGGRTRSACVGGSHRLGGLRATRACWELHRAGRRVQRKRSEFAAETQVKTARWKSLQKIVAVERDIVDEIMPVGQVVYRKLERVLLETVEARGVQSVLPRYRGRLVVPAVGRERGHDVCGNGWEIGS